MFVKETGLQFLPKGFTIKLERDLLFRSGIPAEDVNQSIQPSSRQWKSGFKVWAGNGTQMEKLCDEMTAARPANRAGRKGRTYIQIFVLSNAEKISGFPPPIQQSRRNSKANRKRRPSIYRQNQRQKLTDQRSNESRTEGIFVPHSFIIHSFSNFVNPFATKNRIFFRFHAKWNRALFNFEKKGAFV